jgi:hypothetical protein
MSNLPSLLHSRPLASVSALLVDSAPTHVSMVSTSKVIHQEAMASTSLIGWNFGTGLDEEEGIVWAKEGENYLWEGDEAFPQAQKEGKMQLLLCRVLGLSPRLWMGCLGSLPPFL